MLSAIRANYERGGVIAAGVDYRDLTGCRGVGLGKVKGAAGQRGRIYVDRALLLRLLAGATPHPPSFIKTFMNQLP